MDILKINYRLDVIINKLEGTIPGSELVSFSMEYDTPEPMENREEGFRQFFNWLDVLQDYPDLMGFGKPHGKHQYPNLRIFFEGIKPLGKICLTMIVVWTEKVEEIEIFKIGYLTKNPLTLFAKLEETKRMNWFWNQQNSMYDPDEDSGDYESLFYQLNEKLIKELEAEERRIYDQMLAKGQHVGNLEMPFTDQFLEEFFSGVSLSDIMDAMGTIENSDEPDQDIEDCLD